MSFGPSLSHPASPDGPPPQFTAVCEICGRAPAIDVTFRSMITIVIGVQVSTISGRYCRDCGLAHYRAQTKSALLGGWWGLPAVVLPLLLIMNVVGAKKIERLAPATSVPASALRPGAQYSPPLVPGTPVSRSPALIVPLLMLALVIGCCCGLPRLYN